jgi:dTDP-4-dehydrorhamnose reductase
MNRILVTGSNGQLASEIKELSLQYEYIFYFVSKSELDITNKKEVEIFVNKNDIDTILNCASYTAVDKAEEEKELANSVNHKAVRYLAEISKEKNIKLVHISTDYIFDGHNYQPHIEIDKGNPCSVYGQSKFDGENAMIEVNPKNSIIIRTSWVYSQFGANFVKTMLRLGREKEELGVIFDQIGTPTYAKDLAKVMLDILPKLENDTVEVYHYSNEGVLSWYDFATEIMNMAGVECQVNPIESKDYPTAAQRPFHSLFNKSKIKEKFQITIPYWRESLDRCLTEMGERK